MDTRSVALTSGGRDVVLSWQRGWRLGCSNEAGVIFLSGHLNATTTQRTYPDNDNIIIIIIFAMTMVSAISICQVARKFRQERRRSGGFPENPHH